MSIKTICVTLGDSGGLGVELASRFFSAYTPEENLRVILIGQKKALEYHQAKQGQSNFYKELTSLSDIQSLKTGIYFYEPEGLADLSLHIGQASLSGGICAGRSLECAVKLMKMVKIDGLLTGPIHKASFNEAGFLYAGHTEFLAASFGLAADDVCMHLAGDILRVSLVTTHPALKDVPALITKEKILHCLRLSSVYAKKMGLTAPIGVCGLNPHAGEGGYIGKEEQEIIQPAIELAKKEGILVEGPFAADTLFYFASKGQYSIVLAMYHDQGLAPLKLFHFHEAVNITLGLPVLRTSPDHGTGFDLVGTGKADMASYSKAYTVLLDSAASISD